MKVETKKAINVFYEGQIIGEFEADLVVESKVIIEIKAKEALIEAHENQLINYLRATDIEIGLLLNFGKHPQFKRKFFSDENKRHFSKTEKNDLLKNPLKSSV